MAKDGFKGLGVSSISNKDTKILRISEGLKVEDERSIKESLKTYAKMINDGKTVIFPTETVYGLGADGLNEKAAEKIYLAKGRPSDNPLILHIDRFDWIDKLAHDVSDKAWAVMKKFWPGPLTVVLKKNDIVPDKTSGGLDTIGIRMPSNKVASIFINLADTPIAAPSANISGRPSPTTPEHVISEMKGRVDGIVTWDDCTFGIESTIVDFTGNTPTILRPGAITIGMLKEVVGDVVYDRAIDPKKRLDDENIVAKAPGMKYTHYSPKADVVIVSGEAEKCVDWIREKTDENSKNDLKTVVMCKQENFSLYMENNLSEIYSLGRNNNEVAKNLFKTLINLDDMGYDVIYSEDFSDEGVGMAIMNRLLKSAGYNVQKIK